MSNTVSSKSALIQAGYLALYERGELQARIDAAWAMMARCELCPHRCGAQRLAGEQGMCRTGAQPQVSSWTLHAWEEPPISGSRGSGTIFFSGCTGHCIYCQNYPISQMGYGQTVSTERLAEMMVELQHKGAHNINFVTPTHVMPHILAALPAAIEKGLRLPLVYNTSGYERVESLRLLAGVIELWLPDSKYADDEVARRLSGFVNYVNHNRAALREIYRQVGHRLLLDNEGIAQRGMIVRHMVLPGRLAGTEEVLAWLARALSPRVHVSLMDQYFPAYRAQEDPVLGRKIRWREYQAALEAFDEAGLARGWRQTTTCDEFC